jgi:hypothetical protein
MLAARTLAQLEAASEYRSTTGCEAQFRLASAELAAAEGRHGDAVKLLRSTIVLWLDEGSKINAAHARLKLAQTLVVSGDREAAELELSAARKSFAQMDATQMTARCDAASRELLARPSRKR